MYQGLGLAISQVMPAAVATGLFSSLCTIQQPDGLFGPSGAPSGTYANVAGLVDIPCQDAPSGFGAAIRATEQKAIPEVAAAAPHHVLLSGYFPAIVAGWPQGWQAIVDGVVFDIIGAEVDSQATQTRLEVRTVQV